MSCTPLRPEQRVEALRTRQDLEKVADKMMGGYRQAIRARKSASLKRMMQTDLVMAPLTMKAILSFEARARAVLESEYALSDTLGSQLGITLSLLVEARHAHLAVFEHAKRAGVKSSRIGKELDFLMIAVDRLEQVMQHFLFSYGTRRGSASKLQPSRSRLGSGADEARPQQLAFDENGGAGNGPATPRRGSDAAKPAMLAGAEDGPLGLLLESPLAHFETRLAELDGADPAALYAKCPDLARLRRQVNTFRGQGFEPVVLVLYVAETLGRATLTVGGDSKLRRAFFGVLQQSFCVARANAMTALAGGHGLALASVPVATDADVDSLFVAQ